MRIVLPDQSGSMGDPFEQSDFSSRRVRTTDAETKFAAAKEVLMEELQELKQMYSEMALALFAFTERTQLVYEGSVEDLRGLNWHCRMWRGRSFMALDLEKLAREKKFDEIQSVH